MKVREGQALERFFDQSSGQLFADLEFRGCRFSDCWISTTTDPSLRSTVRNVTLVDCEEIGCTLDAAILEDVVIDGLKTRGLLQVWGAAFKHVTLRGKIGRIMISQLIGTGKAKPREQRAFDEANAEFYSDVDWALDISGAEFEECDLRGVPASLIRRDPETQVIVTREKAMEGAWRGLDLERTYWGTGLEFFLKRGDRDVVFVAPKRGRDFRVLLDGLRALRSAGVAEQD